MSADNAIFVLETPGQTENTPEFRVMHGGMSQVDYFLTEEDYEGLFEYFSRAPVFHCKVEADTHACELIDGTWTEYGIIDISAPLEFKVAEDS